MKKLRQSLKNKRFYLIEKQSHEKAKRNKDEQAKTWRCMKKVWLIFFFTFTLSGIAMNTFNKKYGIEETESVMQFHKSRRMFCILNDILYIAEPNLPYSHAEWFTRQGWMTPDDDSLMNNIPRGMINAQGDIYFFVGYDFDINHSIEQLFFNHLHDLVEKLALKPTANVFGGLVKQTSGGQWPAKKCYGTIEELLQRYCAKIT